MLMTLPYIAHNSHFWPGEWSDKCFFRCYQQVRQAWWTLSARLYSWNIQGYTRSWQDRMECKWNSLSRDLLKTTWVRRKLWCINGTSKHALLLLVGYIGLFQKNPHTPPLDRWQGFLSPSAQIFLVNIPSPCPDFPIFFKSVNKCHFLLGFVSGLSPLPPPAKPYQLESVDFFPLQ